MSRTETLILALAGAIVAFLYGEHRGEHQMAEQIVANENACADGNQPGWASYPVVRLGELRGCLRVPPEAAAKGPRYLRPQAVFVAKREPM